MVMDGDGLVGIGQYCFSFGCKRYFIKILSGVRKRAGPVKIFNAVNIELPGIGVVLTVPVIKISYGFFGLHLAKLWNSNNNFAEPGYPIRRAGYPSSRALII